LLKRGNPSIWQREVRWDFINNVVIILRPLITACGHKISLNTAFVLLKTKKPVKKIITDRIRI
jgi:hypothetical protein